MGLSGVRTGGWLDLYALFGHLGSALPAVGVAKRTPDLAHVVFAELGVADLALAV